MMGIDISNTPEEQLLDVLGNGDWVLELPDNYPDVTISQAIRQSLYDEVAREFVYWVLNGIEIVIDHDSDPPWDSSGSARRIPRDPAILLTKYAILDEWLKRAYTGNSQATYVSGYGLLWETYEDIFKQRIGEVWHEILQDIAKNQTQMDKGDYLDCLYEDTYEVEYQIQHALRLFIGIGSTQAVWEKYRSIVAAEIEREKREAEEKRIQREAMKVLVRQFCDLHFADLQNVKIEMPDYRHMKLGERLTEVLLDTDPATVEALAAVGFQGYFSNSVSNRISQIIQSAHKATKSD